MARVAGAVQIIATDGPAGRAGLTATAVTSVSDKPPTLLVCLNRTSRTAEILRTNGRFSVNVLSVEQEAIARGFADPALSAEERFERGSWDAKDGVPRLNETLAWFSLEISEAREIGSHLVLFGTVISAEAGGAAAPLLYHRRGYRSLIPTV